MKTEMQKVILEGFTEREVLGHVLMGLFGQRGEVERRIDVITAKLMALDKRESGLLRPARPARPQIVKGGAKKKRKMSDAGRAAIAAAQRNRWAKYKKQQKAA